MSIEGSKQLNTVIEYFNGDELAAKVWIEKYALKNRDGELLESSPDQMHERLAIEFSRVEEKYIKSSRSPELSEYGLERNDLTRESILNLFKGFKYLVPQGSVMANLGNEHHKSSLSNCVVAPKMYDSYGGIFYSDQQLAQLYKRRCGVGLDLSSLRPLDQLVNNSAGSTSGAVSFMERFSNTTREVAQHGRRGALMLTIDVNHPEIKEFVKAKSDLTKITGANISVKISNEFMRAVQQDREFELKWPVDSLNPSVSFEVKAREVWDLIIHSAHQNAEPGVLFWDRQHSYSTSSIYPGYENLSTNPCSEIAMQGGDSCRLMAVNLFSFVKNPFESNAEFDFQYFYEVVYEGMRLMDDLVDLEIESIAAILNKIAADPEPDYIKQVEKETWELLLENGKSGRRVGLGFTGLADCLAAMNLKYGSDESLLKLDAIMRIKMSAELDSTIDMSIERGSFEGFDPVHEKKSELVSKMMVVEFPLLYDKMMKFGRRNISFSTVAPTGTLSLMTQTSSGIEPVFQLSYKRRKKVKQKSSTSSTDANGDFWEEFEVDHQKYTIWKSLTLNQNGNFSPYKGALATDVDWKQRISIQKIVQKYTTHSISSTINLPKEATEELVSEIYYDAWRQGLKGITVYRDGSRDGVLVSNEEEVKAADRPDVLKAKVQRFKNGSEEWIAVIGLLTSRPYEIFTGRIGLDFPLPNAVKEGWIKKKRQGNENRYDFEYEDESKKLVCIEGLSRAFDPEYWNYAKLISGVLKLGMPIEDVLHLVETLNLTEDSISTWKAGVARALRPFVKNGTLVQQTSCPSCSQTSSLQYQEGCVLCSNCGFTECS